MLTITKSNTNYFSQIDIRFFFDGRLSPLSFDSTQSTLIFPAQQVPVEFMSTKLETLASFLDPSQCREVRQTFPDDIRFEIMRQKGVLPYSYLTDMEKFKETSLPPKECFYDDRCL
nr:unnamed protein product [Callosobruchus analis]